MARAPKVFTWSDGFHRYTVATTSRAKALAAWETDRDLFKEGVATEAPNAPDAAAALAAPGTVIRGVEGALKATVARAPASSSGKAARARRKQALAKALKKLAEACAEQQAAQTNLESRRRALDAEASELEASWTRRRSRLEASIRRLQP